MTTTKSLLKHDRLGVSNMKNFTFIELDLADREGIAELLRTAKFDRVIHLALPLAFVTSIDNPMAYADSNLVGHLAIWRPSS